MNRRRPREDNVNEYNSGYNKRRRFYPQEAIDKRLARLIFNVDTGDSSVESSIENLAITLESHLNGYKNEIIHIISECAIKFPTKCTLYSTLVGILNTRSYKYGGKFVNHLEVMFNNTLKACEWEEARITLRFLANLVNCNVVSATAFFHLLHSMVNEINDNSVPQVRKDWFVYCVLSTLPWVGRTLHEKFETELDHLLGVIETFIIARTKNHHLILQIWTASAHHQQEEYLDCLWSQVCNLRGNKWNETFIVRPYLAFDSILRASKQHNLPSIILSKHDDKCKYPMPSVVFRIFTDTDCLENNYMPDAHSIERFVIEDNLRSILNWHKLDRKICASALINLYYEKKFPLEYCIIEVLLGELFHLPSSPCCLIAYSSILIELCKFRRLTISQVLVQTIQLLFMRIETMKVICVDRFIKWFTHHISNFSYKWIWENWNDCMFLDAEHPKLRFIREVIERCLKLAYHQRVLEMFPKTFAQLMPLKPESDYKYYKNNATSLPGTRAAHQLIAAIKNHSNIDEILKILNAIPNPQSDQVESDYNPLQIDVFVQTILELGSQTNSHSINKIARFYKVFKILSKSKEAQICILKNLFEVWYSDQQRMAVVIKKLIKITVIECSSVTQWIFSIEMRPELTKLYMWEILNLTFHIMNKHIAKLRGDLSEAINKRFSEEQIEEKQLKIEVAEDDLKNLFLATFQRLTMILSDHLEECDRNKKDYNTYWYKVILGRLEQVFLEHHVQVQKLASKIRTLIFTENLDFRILNTYHQFVSLQAVNTSLTY